MKKKIRHTVTPHTVVQSGNHLIRIDNNGKVYPPAKMKEYIDKPKTYNFYELAIAKNLGYSELPEGMRSKDLTFKSLVKKK